MFRRLFHKLYADVLAQCPLMHTSLFYYGLSPMKNFPLFKLLIAESWYHLRMFHENQLVL